MNKQSRSLNYWLNWAMVVAGVAVGFITMRQGWDVKRVLAVSAIVLTFVANVPYLINAVRGRTEPHMVTWMLLGIITSLAFVVQLQQGAGFDAVPLGVAGAMNFVNCLAGRKQATYRIVWTDVVCGIVALAAVVQWRLSEDPLRAVLFLSAASLVAFWPTVRKAASSPNSETLSTYQRNTIRYLLVVLAIEHMTLTSVLYPAIWVGVNALFSIYLVSRRRRPSVVLKASFA